jgi:hypothetical protein
MQTRPRLLDINKADEASLVQSRDATRAKFEVGTQMQADLLLADNERQKIIEARRDLELKLSDQQSALNVSWPAAVFYASRLPEPVRRQSLELRQTLNGSLNGLGDSGFRHPHYWCLSRRLARGSICMDDCCPCWRSAIAFLAAYHRWE